MLLAVDIGNTTVGFGIFKGAELIREWKIRSDKEKTADEYGIILLELLRTADLEPSLIDGVVLSSVVPPLTPVFQSLSQGAFGRKALVVGPGLRLSLIHI